MNPLLPFPEQASSVAGEVDTLLGTLLAVTGSVVIVIGLLLIGFTIKYRRGNRAASHAGLPPERVELRLEIIWTIIPLLIFLALFAWGAKAYIVMYSPPADALPIRAIGKQWMWKFQHPGGQRELDELHVPVDRPVKLTMISQDVIHSFYVPAFRVKHDVLPGRYSEVWFEATKTGSYHLFCAEFCGTEHSQMRGRVVVLTQTQYQDWLEQHAGAETPAAAGERLFRSFGCSGCHGANSAVRAPALAGIYGHPVPLSTGGTIIADETYIRDSILLPKRQVAAGYEPIMPSFQGQIGEAELFELIAYIKSLKPDTGVER
jgi:cytochrome c oxidase subunit 2